MAIVYNSVTCLQCLKTLVSRHVHDFKRCGCPNDASVDGGSYYQRYGAKDMKKIHAYAINDDDDFELVRQFATRGSRGIDGKQPLTWIPIAQLTDDHIQAILEYGGAEWHLELLKKEIKYRHESNNPIDH